MQKLGKIPKIVNKIKNSLLKLNSQAVIANNQNVSSYIANALLLEENALNFVTAVAVITMTIIKQKERKKWLKLLIEIQMPSTKRSNR